MAELTCKVALAISNPQLKLMETSAEPRLVVERTSFTPGTRRSASSTGRVTCISICCAGWLNPNRRSHNLASVNNVRFCGNSSGCRLMKPAKLGDRSTLSTKLDGLAPLTVPLLLKPHDGGLVTNNLVPSDSYCGP